MGDSWLWVAIERSTKLLLCTHLGKRTGDDANVFIGRLARTIKGRFNLSSDAFGAYPGAVWRHLAGRVDYGKVVKVYGMESKEDRRKYRPADDNGLPPRGRAREAAARRYLHQPRRTLESQFQDVHASHDAAGPGILEESGPTMRRPSPST